MKSSVYRHFDDSTLKGGPAGLVMLTCCLCVIYSLYRSQVYDAVVVVGSIV